MNKATSLSSSLTLLSLIASASAMRKLLKMMNCDNGTNASLSLSLSTEDKICWIVQFLGEFVKVGDQVSWCQGSAPPWGTEPLPAHFLFLCPDMKTLALQIPIGCEFFKYYDLSDAFHT